MAPISRLVLALGLCLSAAAQQPPPPPPPAPPPPAPPGQPGQGRTVVAPLSRIPQGETFTASLKMGVGSPPQTITAIFDTGSSDLWVPRAGSALCADPRGRCSGANANDTGAFDGTKSTTFVDDAQRPFFANYVNGVEVLGDFMTESVTFGGGAVVTNNTMGIADRGTLTAPLVSILGVGPASLEASVVNRQGQPYDNIPAHLKTQGQTTSLIYGVYLNDFRAAEGSVVFGGMDAAKLAGEMQVVPLIGRQQFQTDDFIIAWSSFSFTPGAGAGAPPAGGNVNNNGNNNNNGGTTDLGGRNLPAVLLDTGNPGLSMPGNVIDKIGPAIGVTTAPDGTNVVPCDSGDTGAKFTFGFGAASVDVPISMLFIPVPGAVNAQGKPMCTLPLDVSDGPVASLGAPLLQAAYAVFDMENNVVGMAQAKANATETRIQELRPDWLKGQKPPRPPARRRMTRIAARTKYQRPTRAVAGTPWRVR